MGRTCSISCFSDSESLYKSIKKRGYRNQGGFWACPLALILHINLPIWTGVHNFLQVMRCEWDVLWHRKVSVSVRVGWCWELSVRVTRECVTDCISAHRGNRMISSNSERRGGKNKLKRPRNSSQFSLSVHPVLHPRLLQFLGSLPRAGAFLAARQYAILASLEGFDAWCETKWISFGERRSLIL